jgi:hypothetical protein
MAAPVENQAPLGKSIMSSSVKQAAAGLMALVILHNFEG